jgi:F-type H+-transporting ATPase subunit b
MQGFNSLGIDLTSLLIYLVNFGILYLIISKLLSKPILDLILKRTETIKNNLSEAERLKQEIQKEKEEFENQKKKMREEMNLEMRKFKEALEQKNLHIEKEMNEKREKLMDETRIEIKNKKSEIYSEMQDDILILVSKVVKNFIKEEVSESTIKNSVKEVWKDIQK